MPSAILNVCKHTENEQFFFEVGTLSYAFQHLQGNNQDVITLSQHNSSPAV